MDDIRNEIYAEKRGAYDWVKLIKKHTRSKQLRGWAASIIWWEYGCGDRNGILYDLLNSVNIRDRSCKVKHVMLLLERMGCPKSLSDAAALREKKRNQAMGNYITNNAPVRFGRSVALESVEEIT